MPDEEESPFATLDRSYEQQVEHLADVRRGVAELLHAKSALQLQVYKLQQGVGASGSASDLATKAENLRSRIEALDLQQQQLQAREQDLATRTETFRIRKEILKAHHGVAQAQVGMTALQAAIEAAEYANDHSDQAYAQQRARLGELHGLVATVETVRLRLHHHRSKLQDGAAKSSDAARQAKAADREDLMHLALTRSAEIQGQVAMVEAELVQLDVQLQQFRDDERRLTAMVEASRSGEPPGTQ